MVAGSSHQGPSLRCVISPDRSSVCRGPATSGMRLRALCSRLIPSPVLDHCLDPLNRGWYQPPPHVRLLACPLRVWRLPLVVPQQPVHPVCLGILGSHPAWRGAAGARLAGRGPIQVRGVVLLGLLPLPALFVWLAHLPPLCPLLRARANGSAWCLLLPLVVLALVAVSLGATDRALAMTAPLVLVLWV